MPSWCLIRAEGPAACSIGLVEGDSETSLVLPSAFLVPQAQKARLTTAAEGARDCMGTGSGWAGGQHCQAASVHGSSSSGVLVMAS